MSESNQNKKKLSVKLRVFKYLQTVKKMFGELFFSALCTKDQNFFNFNQN